MKTLGSLKRKSLQVAKINFTGINQGNLGTANTAPHRGLLLGSGINCGSSFSASGDRMNLVASPFDGLTLPIPYNNTYLKYNFDLKFTLKITANATGRIITFDDTGSGDYNLALVYSASDGLQIQTASAHPSGFSFPVGSISVFVPITLNTDYNCIIKFRRNLVQLFLNGTLAITHVVATPLYTNNPSKLKFGGFGTAYSAYGFLDDIDISLVHDKFRTVCDLSFNSLPFTDSTGKSSITNNGATLGSGQSVFSNPADTSTVFVQALTSATFDSDFRLQGDFRVACKFNIASFAGRLDQTLFSLIKVSDPFGAFTSCYVRNTGQIVLNFDDGTTYTTAAGVISTGINYTLLVEKTGNLASIRINGNAVHQSTPVIATLEDTPRYCLISSRSLSGGFGLNGNMDYFVFSTE
jgi:hypothetical protein